MLVLLSGYEISRPLSTLADKAQLQRDFHLKRVPTIPTIERRAKRTREERPLQGRGKVAGTTFSPTAGGAGRGNWGSF